MLYSTFVENYNMWTFQNQEVPERSVRTAFWVRHKPWFGAPFIRHLIAECPINRISCDQIRKTMKQSWFLVGILLLCTSIAFVCNSTMKTIPSSRVNDGYCDCEDGSDEWETYVCNQNTFVCKQEIGKDGYDIHYRIMHRNQRILASMFVNDGLCDCCDCSYQFDWFFILEMKQIPSVLNGRINVMNAMLLQSWTYSLFMMSK